MEHMSRERISFDQRIRLIRENYGSVSYQAGFITVCSYTWMLTVNAKSTLQFIGLMISVRCCGSLNIRWIRMITGCIWDTGGKQSPTRSQAMRKQRRG